MVISFSFLVLVIYLNACGNKRGEKETPQKPAEVTNQVKENSLTTIRLTVEAEQRLGLGTRPAEIRNLHKTLTLGGEVMVPPGQEAKVTAPVSGKVCHTPAGYFPVAGSPVQMNQEIMRLIVIPPETDIISASDDVSVKQVEYEAALAELKRAETLLENRAISDKVFESTKAKYAKAEASLKASMSRLDLYMGKNINAASENLSAFILESPVTGVIQNINVAPGQIIASSATLFEVSQMNRFWIRVPVYSGDLASIDTGQKATISTMGNRGKPGLIAADPIQGPLLSNASSASSYLYYQVDNRTGMLRSGQKVSVTLSLRSAGEHLAVPYSSIIYDIRGGTWVYVRSAPQVYIRTRVDLDHVSDGLAVIIRGLSPGDEVVYAGAAELFGTEFGVGK